MTKTRKFFIGLFLGQVAAGMIGCVVAIIWFIVAMISATSCLLPGTIGCVGTIFMISGWSIVLILNGWKWGETPPANESEDS